MNKIRLVDLISIDALQQIQDGFSKYTGMASLTTDAEGVPVTKGSGFTEFCMELTRQSKEGCRHCEECDRNGALLTLRNGHATVYDCHAGLVDFAAPIMLEGMFIGSFIGGQVRTDEVDEEQMRATAIRYGIDPEAYIDAAKQTRCLKKQEIEKAAIFLEEIAAGLSGIAYKNYKALQESIRMEQAAKSQADFVMGMSDQLESSMDGWLEILQDAVAKTDNPEIGELLTRIQQDGMEACATLRDSIDYIRMSEKKLELLETEYSLDNLLQGLQDVLRPVVQRSHIEVEIVKGSCVCGNLFGDSGRIGQMLNKLIRTLLDGKQTGTIRIEVSTSRVSYATMLTFSIVDFNTNVSQEDVDRFKVHFARTKEQFFSNDDLSYMWMPFVKTMLSQMSGTMEVTRDMDDLKIEICLPQLAL
ncbi:MAG: PocR ligand-binding domain-containing protein [Wujia sp.]